VAACHWPRTPLPGRGTHAAFRGPASSFFFVLLSLRTDVLSVKSRELKLSIDLRELA